jgi:prepilin-type processing-associated H-X9-DG protein
MNVEGIDEVKYQTQYPAEVDVATFPQIKQPHAGAGDAIGVNSIHAYRRSQVRHPAEKLSIVDAMWIIVNELGSGPLPPNSWQGKNCNYDYSKEDTTALTQRTTAWRHQGGANVLFFDGHVEWLRKDQIYSRDASNVIVANHRLWRVTQ